MATSIDTDTPTLGASESDTVQVSETTSRIPATSAIPKTAEELAERETKCKSIIESIRHDEFGIGLHLDEKQQEIAKKQRLREGRGLQRLSLELYSKDTHFVLELIQNADDNDYSSLNLVEVPFLKFIITSACITVLNNESGFYEKNIRAICDVGKSTKGAHLSGYIGQKGIGFKSVFRITDTPEIHSNGFYIRFDASSDPIGYILPHWINEHERSTEEHDQKQVLHNVLCNTVTLQYVHRQESHAFIYV